MYGIRKPLIGKPGTVDKVSSSGQGAFVREHAEGVMERGQVVSVYPDTMSALVSIKAGTVPATLPSRSSAHPDYPTGGASVPYRGAEVLVTEVNGQYHIVRYLPPKDVVALDDDTSSRRVELVYDPAGAEEGYHKNKGYTRRSGMNPSGLLPGDDVTVGRLGNMIGVLEGGVNLIRSHDLAQIITLLREQLVKIVASNYSLFTDFGKIEHTSDDRGASLKLRGAGGTSAEAGNEGWTVRADLGASGDLVNLRVTDFTGFDLARLWASRLGNVYTKTKDHIHEVYGQSAKYVRGKATDLYDSDKTSTVRGVYTLVAEKRFEQRLDSLKRVVANTLFSSVMDDATYMVGGKRTDVVVDGHDIEVTSGPVRMNVGKDVAEDTGVTCSIRKGSYSVSTDESGDLVFSTPQGDIKLTTSVGKAVIGTAGAPDSVFLGSDGATFHVVKYEQLKALFNSLAVALDSHQHFQTPVTTAVTGPVSTSGLFSGVVGGAISTVKSDVVKVSS